MTVTTYEIKQFLTSPVAGEKYCFKLETSILHIGLLIYYVYISQ